MNTSFELSMPDPDYKALCAELLDAYAYLIDRYMTAPSNKDALVYRARAALVAEPEPVAPTDEELMAAARKAVDTYPRVSELPYFLSEDSCEYEPMLLALRAAARWSMPTNNIRRED
jgi:hypothetical protein